MYFFYSDVFQVTLLPHMTDSAQIFFQKMEGMNPSPPLSNKPPFSSNGLERNNDPKRALTEILSYVILQTKVTDMYNLKE